MTKRVDIAVIGSGFGGSLLAMIARRLGRSVVLVEKGKHPRFAIGESSTPLANLLLDELARKYDLPRLRRLTEWGKWQESHPGLACGLKRGFTFYHHSLGRPFIDDGSRKNQLLVAASPHDRVADTHWYRPHFDQFLVQEAQHLGVEFLDETAVEIAHRDAGGFLFRARRRGRRTSFRARFVIDATGPRGFLFHALGLRERRLPNLPDTEGLYAHFRGVDRLDNSGTRPASETPPYPVDDAAVHHVFDGGWIWILRFNNGITSAGVAATRRVAERFGLSDGRSGWRRLLKELPTVQRQFATARTVHPFVHAAQLSFACETAVGTNWALLPSAAGFIDPLLSTGFPLTLLGVERLAGMIDRHWGRSSLTAKLKKYERKTFTELFAAENLVSALYKNLGDFEVFSSLSLLYFAAASFAESARRLDRPKLASSFLLHDTVPFGRELNRCCELARVRRSPGQRTKLLAMIRRAIEPINVAGLTDRARRNWFPVKGSDLMAAASKLGVTPARVRNFLQVNGF